MRVKYFVVIVWLFVKSFNFALGVPFGNLPYAWRFYHIFLSSQVVLCYNTDPLVRNSLNNVFAVGFELCYEDGNSRFFYVNKPFISGKDNPEKEAVHKALECKCENPEDRDFVRNAALKDSEFVFLCEFDNFVNVLNRAELLKGVQMVRIHGCSALDMCPHCFFHMSAKLDRLKQNPKYNFDFQICISSLFDYEKKLNGWVEDDAKPDAYKECDVTMYAIEEDWNPQSKSVCCVPLRKNQGKGGPRNIFYTKVSKEGGTLPKGCFLLLNHVKENFGVVRRQMFS